MACARLPESTLSPSNFFWGHLGRQEQGLHGVQLLSFPHLSAGATHGNYQLMPNRQRQNRQSLAGRIDCSASAEH